MTKISLIIPAIFLCFGAYAATERDVFDAASEGRIDRIEKSISNIQKILSTSYEDKEDSSIQSQARRNAMNYAQFQEVKEQIKAIRGDIEQLQFDNTKTNEKLTKLAADFEFRFSELEKKFTPQSPETITKTQEDNKHLESLILLQDEDNASADKLISNEPVSKTQKKKKIETEYNAAFSLLKKNEYDKAIIAFEKFLVKYADSPQASSAYYWIGEIYFSRAEYDNAASKFLSGYQNSPTGSKAPNNLLKLAESMAKFDKRKEACTAYAKLKKEFPKAPNHIKQQMVLDIKTYKCGNS